MKFLFAIIICTFSFLFINAQDIEVLLKEAARHEMVPDEKASFSKYKEVLKINPSNILALTKCSELCSRIGQRELANPKLRDDYYKWAVKYADAALNIAPDNSEANCVMAIALGRSSMTKSGRDKIDNAREIKKYLDVALKNDPHNFKAWHVLGRWQYEISNLNAVERGIVKVFYGGMPLVTLQQSIASFERARSLRPEFLLNYLEMAKAYKENNQKTKAIAYLQQMLSLPIQTEDDAAIKEKGKILLKKWQ
ncbi:MAG: hypothetical protein KF825_09435 [Ferruginibacter sp.]|nr:hypothetical protein [Ferruginibacter sp.]